MEISAGDKFVHARTGKQLVIIDPGENGDVLAASIKGVEDEEIEIEALPASVPLSNLKERVGHLDFHEVTEALERKFKGTGKLLEEISKKPPRVVEPKI